MKTISVRFIHIAFVFFVLTGLFFGNVPSGSAQSSRQWSNPVNVSQSGLGKEPSLVVDNQGVLHAIWEDTIDEFKYSKSIDNGKTWSKPETVRYPFAKGKPTQFLVDNEGVVNIFWVNQENELMYNRSIPDELGKPFSWEREYRMARFVLNFHADISPYGAMHVAYINVRNPGGVYVRSSLGLGRGWDEARLLFESSYFRALQIPVDGHVRVAVSDDPDRRVVHVVWDNRPEKRVYIASSFDDGETWRKAKEFKGPKDTGGFGTPYNSTVGMVGSNQVLFMWQVGEPGGSQCGVYGQWSFDGGVVWEEPIQIMDNRSPCPQGVNLISQDGDRTVVIFSNIGTPSLLAWDANKKVWSEVQPQDEFSYFSNPLTYETISLSCQKFFLREDELYQIACDSGGGGGDIWVTSRSISTWKTWFPPSTIWNLPAPLVSTANTITSVTTVADATDLYSVWVETSPTDPLGQSSSISFTRWSDGSWAAPQRIISGTKGKPSKLSMATNNIDRLFLAFVDEQSGELFFAWANSQRANSASEWSPPELISGVEGIVGSSDIAVDVTGRVMIVYAVPLNEGRGVYVVQSTDNGLTWSDPIKVFDAVEAGWQSVDQPKIAVGNDGVLHILFTQYSVTSSKPQSTYYSQSVTGGSTWAPADAITENPVLWSDLVSFSNSVHRVWQEDNNGVISNLDQVSNDSGKNWSVPLNITPISSISMPVTIISNGINALHFVYLQRDASPGFLKEYALSVQASAWDGSVWQQQPFYEFQLRGEEAQFALVGGLTFTGQLEVAIHVGYQEADGDITHTILNTGRLVVSSVTEVNPDDLEVVIIPSMQPLVVEEVPTPIVDSQLTTLPNELANIPASPARNYVGAGLFVLVSLVLFIYFLRRAIRR